jgi:hypothetical protein
MNVLVDGEWIPSVNLPVLGVVETQAVVREKGKGRAPVRIICLEEVYDAFLTESPGWLYEND